MCVGEHGNERRCCYSIFCALNVLSADESLCPRWGQLWSSCCPMFQCRGRKVPEQVASSYFLTNNFKKIILSFFFFFFAVFPFYKQWKQSSLKETSNLFCQLLNILGTQCHPAEPSQQPGGSRAALCPRKAGQQSRCASVLQHEHTHPAFSCPYLGYIHHHQTSKHAVNSQIRGLCPEVHLEWLRAQLFLFISILRARNQWGHSLASALGSLEYFSPYTA